MQLSACGEENSERAFVHHNSLLTGISSLSAINVTDELCMCYMREKEFLGGYVEMVLKSLVMCVSQDFILCSIFGV